jgi:hypothetical protein
MAVNFAEFLPDQMSISSIISTNPRKPLTPNGIGSLDNTLAISNII